MAKLKILIEGYAKETSDGWLASSSTVLIEDANNRIIVDPGINRGLLLEKLKEEGLTPNDINIVFMTHYHPDHMFLSSMFKKALALDGNTIYEKDKETEYEDTVPGTNFRVIPTPGHAHEHCSLLVPTGDGNVIVAGDVFWWTDGEEQETDDSVTLLNREDPFVKDKNALIESRKKILETADWVIPGHGKMFEVMGGI